jgi:PKD repeat protein
MPLEVAFDSSVAASNCAGTPAFAWDFGDGGSSAEARPDYTYTAPGRYAWRLDVTVEDQVCTVTGTVEVLPVVPGDCDGNGNVSIGEVQGATNMFLGAQPAECGADCDGNNAVSIGELQRVINAFLGFEVTC